MNRRIIALSSLFVVAGTTFLSLSVRAAMPTTPNCDITIPCTEGCQKTGAPLYGPAPWTWTGLDGTSTCNGTKTKWLCTPISEPVPCAQTIEYRGS